MIEFDRLVAVVNPVSSQARKTVPRLHNIRQHFPRAAFEAIETTADQDQTVEDILNKTETGDLTLVLGGDGAFHDAMLATVGRQIPLLPLWGGNGNDMAHMLNGVAPAYHQTHELIREGNLVDIKPIELVMSGLRTHYAAAYAGFGVMAEGAEVVKDPAYRGRPGYRLRPVRAAYEAAALIPKVFGAQQFAVNNEDAYGYRTTDISFYNGSRVAKYGRPPVSLTERRIYMTECASNLRAAAWIVALLAGHNSGQYIQEGESYNFYLPGDVRGHVDAETFEVPAGTDVRVGVYAESFTAVSRRL